MPVLEKSAALHARALKSLVGGVNSPVRSFRRVGGQPILARSGSGAWLTDVDGNRYVDLVMSYGPHLFGHARKEIIDAASAALKGSSCLGLTSEGEIEWAELVLKRLNGAEKVRALSTGTEACMTAIRLARGITGRDLVVKFSGHYHGHVDSLMVDAGSGVATLSEEVAPDSKGLPRALTELARVANFNDLVSVEEIFRRDGARIAAVILEPIMGNMGVVPPQASFLKGLRKVCDQHGALLIFDEVMTGLRVHRGSAQTLYGTRPDLTCLGKVVGGGLPLSALAGPAKYMDQLAPLGGVYQAGTLSGNPVAIAAGLAMLKLIDREDPYAKVEAAGRRLENIFQECAAERRIDLRVERVGSMISAYFRKDPVSNAADCRAVNEEHFNRFFRAMLEEGIMLPPSPFEACFLAVPHGELATDDFEGRVQKAFRRAFA